MTTYRELKIKEAGGLVSVGDPRTSEALVSTEARQFGAAGSVLDNVPMRVHPAEQLLKYSVLWLDAAHSSASNQTIQNLGWGGSALNAQNGSTTGADSNDALFLDWTGENYVYMPGVVGNFLSVPDEAALDITGDIDIRVKAALDDWRTSPVVNTLVGKWDGVAGQQSYILWVTSGGLLSLYWTENGSTSIVLSSTTSVPFAQGQVGWVRGVLDVDNGSSGKTVTFYTSLDGIVWTVLGTPRTTTGVTSIFSGTSPFTIGKASNQNLSGKVYRAQIFNGIDGTKVLDVDTSVITSGAATTFTALTGQTVTINRSTAGRKAVAVVSPCWLFGTDDFMRVSDNDLIDFGASDSFTVLVVVRQWATPVSSGYYVSKRSGSPQTGYSINASGNPLFWSSALLDGVNTKEVYPAYPTAGTVLVASSTVNRVTQFLTSYVNGSPGGATSTSGLGSLVNAGVLAIGSFPSGGSNQDFELLAVAVFRRALTATEISQLTTYYQSRIGG